MPQKLKGKCFKKERVVNCAKQLLRIKYTQVSIGPGNTEAIGNDLYKTGFFQVLGSVSDESG